MDTNFLEDLPQSIAIYIKFDKLSLNTRKILDLQHDKYNINKKMAISIKNKVEIAIFFV
ncbi:transcriptional regulator [Staphylococcus sp. HMSC73C01]|nr:transcriptional regulator [Staphylococcus lugdunensis]OHP76643.1 transcriptional regulator [Staphylococcus sp. HMSC062D12]OHP87168.1 transcriptional regulator [Staphylococcus sp. HMSC063E12]OHS38352.1 transcriptional regulator [Staphylococcus sp. HMSC62D11]OHS56242.1 transcriptional regulator [Staphylococcus sp. HMSC69H07]OHS67150.1 transcriptional regulator [Staphylococcus sp. HMSC73C01]